MANARKPVPPGYQVTDRGGAFWCQREIMPGIWQDIGGPYRQRISAVQKAERDADRRQGLAGKVMKGGKARG